MEIKNPFSYKYPLLASFLIFVLIVLGVFTRLTDAGLGCPDVPGCYGQLTVPHTEQGLNAAHEAFPNHPVEATKAWTEMGHRYIAAFSGTFILILCVVAIAKRKKTNHSFWLPALLACLTVFQITFGALTVTLKLLPLVVMGHLFGALALLSLLWVWHLQLRPNFKKISVAENFKPLAIAGLIMVIIQVALGGWTSVNYAGFACLDFPFCHGTLWPNMDFSAGFNFFNPIGPNYEGGVLDMPARVAIHMTHRFGALFTLLIVGFLSLKLLFAKQNQFLQALGGIIFVILFMQITLGILNITAMMPLPIAIAHTAVASLLLVSLVTLAFVLFRRPVGS